MTLVVLPLVIFRTTFWPFLSTLRERTVSVNLPVPLALRLVEAGPPASRTEPVSLVFGLVGATAETLQAIDLRFLASLQLVLSFRPAAFLVAAGATVVAFGAGAAAAGAGAAAGGET